MIFTLIFSSCHTSNTVPVETIKTTTKTDTLYINNVQYDSIYVSQNKYIDRCKDTILIRQHDIEYRYKLLRDTVCRTKVEFQRDSIPYEIKVVETKEVKYTPWYTKTLAWIGAICLLILALFIVYKITKVYIAK